MTKEQYERERQRILDDARYSKLLRVWALCVAEGIYEESKKEKDKPEIE